MKMQLITCILLVAISFGEGRVVLPGAKEAGLVSSENAIVLKENRETYERGEEYTIKSMTQVRC